LSGDADKVVSAENVCLTVLTWRTNMLTLGFEPWQWILLLVAIGLACFWWFGIRPKRNE